MKYLFPCLVLSITLFQGCDLRQREEAIKKKEAELNRKEQALQVRETTVKLKEEEVQKRVQEIDSTRLFDSTDTYNTAMTGNWDVTMTCTETSCHGSAVGDTKTETWEISYRENKVIAQAKVNNELVRIYSGSFTGNTLELVEARNQIPNNPATRMVVRLRLANKKRMEGHREIERIGQCKILYETVLTKK